MGLPCKWFIMSVCCISGIYSYSVRPIEDENGEPAINLDKDLLFGFEPKDRFFDNFEDDRPMYDHGIVESTRPPDNASTPLDSWSVVWYIASFGGLIIFFLIVSCSEWCCRRAIRNSQSCNNRNTPTATTPNVPDTPPPSYDQFAPPSYESICLGRNGRGGEKSEYDIYVVPVHTFGQIMESRQEDAPPSYFTASGVTRLENQVATVT